MKQTNRTSTMIVNAKEVVSLLREDASLAIPVTVTVSDFRASDSKVVKDKDGLDDYLERLGVNDHVTHLGMKKDMIYLDIKRGGAIKEKDKDIEEQGLTGQRGYHGIYTLDSDGIKRFYMSKLHFEDTVMEALLTINADTGDTAVSPDELRNDSPV